MRHKPIFYDIYGIQQQLNSIYIISRLSVVVNTCLKGENSVKNERVRAAAKQSGVRLWQLAERIGINDGNLSRRLRRELSDEEQERMISIIDEIAAEKEEQNYAEDAND